MTIGPDPPCRNAVTGKILTALGVVLFIVGIIFCIGLGFGVVTRFPYAGVAAMFVGNIMGWIGQSLTVGKLKSDIKAIVRSEVKDTLRLRTGLSPQAAVLVVIGFALVVIAAVVVWSVVTQGPG
jgi:hypothetical protein